MGTIALDVLPISTLLTMLTDQVIATYKAAYDVLIEKQSFHTLASYLEVIAVYLKDLSRRNLQESPVGKRGLQALLLEVKKADSLITKVKNSPKIYNLLYCGTIVKNLQKAVQDIGSALQELNLASVEVNFELHDNVEHAYQQMLSAEFRASEENLELLGKLKHGIEEQRYDTGFANDILMGIARSLGLSQQQEISRELESLENDREEAARRKELQEENYVEQVIALLSRADAAYSWNASRDKYSEFKERVVKNSSLNAFLVPFQSFKCPLTKKPMTDPVIIASDKTYEREAIQEWFEKGGLIDPVTREQLPNTRLRPNRTLLQSISEWRDHNFVARILDAKRKLESGEQKAALQDLSKLCEESFVNKDWIAFEGLVPSVVELLSGHSPELERMSVATLYLLVKDNEHNQEIVINAGGLRPAVKCLMGTSSTAQSAAVLLLELIKNESGRSNLEDEPGVFQCLVTCRVDQEDMELMETAGVILDQLSDKDKNVIEMAKANWCRPLVNCLCEGPDESKLAMASSLSMLALDDSSLQVIVEGGALSQLVYIANSGDLRIKVTALRALQNLSSHTSVKRCIAETGAVPLLLRQLSNRKSLPELEELSSAILMNLALKDGMTYLVDGDGSLLQQKKLIQNLLGILNRPASGAVWQHILSILIELAQPSSAQQIRKLLREEMCIPLLLAIIEGKQIKLCASAVQLLFCLSNEGGGTQIASFLSLEGSFGTLVELMRSNTLDKNVQVAVAGILANFPMEDNHLRDSLLTANVAETLIDMISSEDILVMESALGALLTFTDQSDVDMQLRLAQLEIFPLLNNVLKSGSAVAKIRAATCLRNFSSSTILLIEDSPNKGCLCFRNGSNLCRIHRAKCEAKKTLCIFEAKAIPELVGILEHPDCGVAEAGMDALFTLLVEDSMVENAIKVLHEAEVMNHLLHLLTNGSTECIHKAVKFVEVILRVPRMRAMHSQVVRTKLSSITDGNHSPSLHERAAAVLTLLI